MDRNSEGSDIEDGEWADKWVERESPYQC